MTWGSRIDSSAPHSARVTIAGALIVGKAPAGVVFVAGFASATRLSNEATAAAPTAPAAASRRKRRRGNASSLTHCSHMGESPSVGTPPATGEQSNRAEHPRVVIPARSGPELGEQRSWRATDSNRYDFGTVRASVVPCAT